MYLPEKHFELLDQKELTFCFQNIGIVESEVDGREYNKFVVMLIHGKGDYRNASQKLVFGTTELFSIKEATMALVCTDVGLPSLIDENWYQFEASGCSYDLNFWFNDFSEPQASIYLIEDGDTDCSTIIHSISNFQIDYE